MGEWKKIEKAQLSSLKNFHLQKSCTPLGRVPSWNRDRTDVPSRCPYENEGDVARMTKAREDGVRGKVESAIGVEPYSRRWTTGRWSANTLDQGVGPVVHSWIVSAGNPKGKHAGSTCVYLIITIHWDYYGMLFIIILLMARVITALRAGI